MNFTIKYRLINRVVWNRCIFHPYRYNRAPMDMSKTNRHFRDALLETVPCSVFMVDINNQIIFGNRSAEELTQYRAQEMIGLSCDHLHLTICSSQDPEVRKTFCPLLSGGRAGEVECEIHRKDGTIVPGGGASEIEVAQALRSYAATIEGREQLAISSFADAIEELPKAIAENCGFDTIDTIINLRAKHGTVKNAGLDVETGDVIDMLENGVIDPLRVKTQAIKSASEAAIIVLRVDDMLRAKEQAMMDVKPEHNIHNYDMSGMM